MSLLEHWSERLEPVLVKDLRAALRGKAFALTLLAAVSLMTAMLLYVLVLRTIDGAEPEGDQLFQAVAWAAHAVMGVFVPLWAFTSLGQELDGDTFDLLSLSHLSAWRIVWGKFLAAMLQCLLVFCAAFPFAFMAFLLGGIDAWSVCMRMLGILALSGACVAICLCLSTLVRTRWMRAVMLALAAFGLFWLHGPMFFRNLRIASSTGGAMTAVTPVLQMVAELAVTAALAGLFLAFAGARLAHEEQSRSTPVRVWVAILTVAYLVEVLFVARATGMTEPIALLAFGMLPLDLLVLLFLCTEREPLPRATGWLPRGRVRALLASPFLAGGGRGALYSLLLLGGLASYVYLMSRLATPASGQWRASVLSLFGLASFYVLLPSALLARWNTDARRTRWVRIVIAGGWAVLWIGAALAAMLTEGRFEPTRMFFSPVFGGNELFGDDGSVRAPVRAGLLLFVTVLAVLANAPRIVRGVREVLARTHRHASTAARSAAEILHAPPRT